MKSLVGVNIEWVRDWGKSHMYADITRHARRPDKLSAPFRTKANVDSNGWPTEDFFLVVKTDTENVNGNYKISFNGKANLSANNPLGKIEFSGQSYDAENNKTTLNMNVEGAKNIWLNFSGTNGGVKNLKIMLPGHAETEDFNRVFLDKLTAFSTIRFMDFFETNENASSKWSERRDPNRPFKESEKSPEAYETAIELCNETKKDMWLNIPCLADDDHITKLCQLVNNKLDPDLVVYIEIGNELWNSQFHATKEHWAKAQSEASAYKYKNHFFDRTARRLCDAVKIARTILPKERVRGIIGAQVANPYVATRQLEYIREQYGNPSDFAYAVAIAPYLNVSETIAAEGSALTIVNNLLSRVEKANQCAQGHDALATNNGLKLVCYEGGPDLGWKDVNLANKFASQEFELMRDVIIKYLNSWFSNPKRGLFMYYNLCGKYSKSGIWGATNNIYVVTPKLKGLFDVAKAKQWDDVFDPGTPTPTPVPTPVPIPTPTPTPAVPVPTGLRVVLENGRLRLSWNSVSGATYIIYRNGNKQGTSTDTLHFVADVSPAEYQVSAVRGEVESSKSSVVAHGSIPIVRKITSVDVRYDNATAITIKDKPIAKLTIFYEDGTTKEVK